MWNCRFLGSLLRKTLSPNLQKSSVRFKAARKLNFLVNVSTSIRNIVFLDQKVGLGISQVVLKWLRLLTPTAVVG